jgi:hypothetical protein
MIKVPGIRILSTIVSSLGEYDRCFETGGKQDGCNYRMSKESEVENNALYIDPKEDIHRYSKIEMKRNVDEQREGPCFWGGRHYPLLTPTIQ